MILTCCTSCTPESLQSVAKNRLPKQEPFYARRKSSSLHDDKMIEGHCLRMFFWVGIVVDVGSALVRFE